MGPDTCKCGHVKKNTLFTGVRWECCNRSCDASPWYGQGGSKIASPISSTIPAKKMPAWISLAEIVQEVITGGGNYPFDVQSNDNWTDVKYKNQIYQIVSYDAALDRFKWVCLSDPKIVCVTGFNPKLERFKLRSPHNSSNP